MARGDTVYNVISPPKDFFVNELRTMQMPHGRTCRINKGASWSSPTKNFFVHKIRTIRIPHGRTCRRNKGHLRIPVKEQVCGRVCQVQSMN